MQLPTKEQIEYIYGYYGTVDCIMLTELLNIEFEANWSYDDVCQSNNLPVESVEAALIYKNI